MTRDRAGGTALIVSAAGFIITMALHPITAGPLSVAVHALALVCLPIAFVGVLVLSQQLNGLAALGALVTYGFGAVAIMNAAVYSGLVAPSLMAYTHVQNQAFALVYVVASSVAIVLWSVAMVTRTRGIAIAGMILGPLILIVVFSHRIGLDVHGFGAIVLAQAAWFIASGVWLIRLER